MYNDITLKKKANINSLTIKVYKRCNLPKCRECKSFQTIFAPKTIKIYNNKMVTYFEI